MLVFCGNIRQANSFLAEKKNYEIKDFSVTIVKSVPYFTLDLHKNESDRPFDYELCITQRTGRYMKLNLFARTWTGLRLFRFV